MNDSIEIFLQPGEFYFGDRYTRIRTILGSCVAITMWHPTLIIGGMCHYLLPSRKSQSIHKLDGRYGDEALLLFLNEQVKHGTSPLDYVIKVFGGGKMLSTKVQATNFNIGNDNVTQAKYLLNRLGFKISAEHTGDIGHRNVIFDVHSGDVWVKHTKQKLMDR